MIALPAAITTAIVGNIAVALGAASDTATGTNGGAIGPWLQGGGSAAAVGGLVYVARLIIKGDLVPRAVADRENETNAYIRAANERETMTMAREQKYAELNAEGMAREQVAANIQDETNKLLGQALEVIRPHRITREGETR